MARPVAASDDDEQAESSVALAESEATTAGAEDGMKTAKPS